MTDTMPTGGALTMTVPTIAYLDGGQKSGLGGGYVDPETHQTVQSWSGVRRPRPIPAAVPARAAAPSTDEEVDDSPASDETPYTATSARGDQLAAWAQHQALHDR